MNVLEKILEEIKEMRDIMKSTVTTNCFGKECEHNDCTVCVCERAMEIIRSHMKEAESDDWIPVKKRLPEESLDSVIGWDKYRERCVFVQFRNGRWIFGNDIEPVLITAWRTLPEPYKGD